jgi:CRP-like cAMP-binding protein
MHSTTRTRLHDLRKNADLAVLAQYGWLSLTPDSFRQKVLARVTKRVFDVGEWVFRLRDPSDGIWGIVEGAVLIELPSATHLANVAHFAVRGFWFGVGPLIHDMPRRIGVMASERSVLVRLALADCRELLEENSADWRWMALLSTMETDAAMGVVADLLLTDPRQRIIATLLRLAGSRNGTFRPSMPLPLSLTQERIGLICNLSRTVVSSVLRDLEDQKMIRTEYRRVIVLDDKRMLALLVES